MGCRTQLCARLATPDVGCTTWGVGYTTRWVSDTALRQVGYRWMSDTIRMISRTNYDTWGVGYDTWGVGHSFAPGYVPLDVGYDMLGVEYDTMGVG